MGDDPVEVGAVLDAGLEQGVDAGVRLELCQPLQALRRQVDQHPRGRAAQPDLQAGTAPIRI